MTCRDIIGRASIEYSRFGINTLAEIVSAGSCLGLDRCGENGLLAILYQPLGLVQIENEKLIIVGPGQEQLTLEIVDRRVGLDDCSGRDSDHGPLARPC